MKKLSFLFALTFISATFANELCVQTCEQNYKDAARACYNVKEFCFKHGPVGTEGYDYCMENWDNCLVKINASKNTCLDNCQN